MKNKKLIIIIASAVLALAVVIGVAVVTMYSSFMVEDGLIQGFTEDIISIVIEKVTAMIE